MKALSEKKIAVERARMEGMWDFQRELVRSAWADQAQKPIPSRSIVIGVDEVGRGPLCGPVTAAACVLPADCEILFLNDSKKLSEERRESLFAEIREKATAFGIGERDAGRIDAINILNATFEAMQDAVQACLSALLSDGNAEEAKIRSSVLVLVDGNKRIPNLPFPQLPVVKGDGKCPSIAAASICAKVTRDHEMYAYDKQYPGYGFAQNKGYGTAAHYEGLKALGLTPIHRRSFLKNFAAGNEAPF